MSHVCPLNRRSCRCNPEAAQGKFLPCALARRIGVMVRMIGEERDETAIAAAHGLRRLLPAEGIAFSDLAVVIENWDSKIEQLKYSDTDAQAIFARGLEVGRKQGRTRAVSVDFFDEDAEPRWAEIASFCQGCPAMAGLKSNEQEFIDEMSAKLRWRAPSSAQGGFLLSIFWKLRGSLR